MNPTDDDFEPEHYRPIIEDFIYELGVEPEDVTERAGDLLDILLLNGWQVKPL